MTGGVALDELCCPTCQRRIVDFVARCTHHLESDFDVDYLVADIITRPRTFGHAPFLTCPSGHMWTIKAIWRAQGSPDQVLLGEYLGVDKQWA